MNSKVLLPVIVLGVFSVLSTELSISGILPIISSRFDIPITQASILVSVFALVIVVSGLVTPLIFSKYDRKKCMLLVLGVFSIVNVISAFAPNFGTLLIARIAAAAVHPVYCSLAFVVAAELAEPGKETQAASKIIMGVSAGMILGVPITTFLANSISYEISMLFLALLNGVVFVCTLFLMDSMEGNKESYGDQVKILKRPILIVSLACVVLVTATGYGLYSYLTEYLQSYTGIAAGNVSAVLLLFGAFSLIGNYLAGKLLAVRPTLMLLIAPTLLAVIYLTSFFFGSEAVLMIIITMPLGLVFGTCNNIQQYDIVSVAQDAPSFANGLFLSFSNLGVTFGTAFCGLFISGMGLEYVMIGGVILAIVTLAITVVRQTMLSKRTVNQEMSG